MSEPTLVQVFGANASQTATDLLIKKSDLVATGLTAATSNTAESLLVAILLLAANYLNSTIQATNTDIQVTIDNSGFPSIAFRNNANYRQITYNVNLQKLDTTSTIDPDDY